MILGGSRGYGRSLKAIEKGVIEMQTVGQSFLISEFLKIEIKFISFLNI